MNIKLDQWIKVENEPTLRQVHSIGSGYVECWVGGNLVKYLKSHIEDAYKVDTSHLELIESQR